VALRQQQFNHMAADVPGPAGDENLHNRCFSPW
jgi:hypothetical protein